MNSKERLIAPRDAAGVKPMAARAVALCEGCPMAKFCVVKQAAPCETSAVQAMHIESGGGYEAAALDKPIRTSYRDELFDNSKTIVMAEIQKLSKPKESVRPQPMPVPPSRMPVQVAHKKPVATTPPTRVKPAPRVERSGEGGAGILAGIIASMVGIKD